MALSPAGRLFGTSRGPGGRGLHLAGDPLAKARPVEVQTCEVPKLFSRFGCIGLVGQADVTTSIQVDLRRAIAQHNSPLGGVWFVFYSRPFDIDFIALHGDSGVRRRG